MLVKDLAELIKGMNQDAEVVVRDHSCDDDNEVGNAYTIMEAQEGFFDEEVNSFVSVEEVDPDEEQVFGVESVAITFERL